LNREKINHCERTYKERCRPKDDRVYDVDLDCMGTYLAQAKACEQAYDIYRLGAYPPTGMRLYNKKIVVLKILYLSGFDGFYMVDNKGKLIGLSTDEGLLNKNAEYIALKKIYSDLILSDSVVWSESDEERYPKQEQLGKGFLRLIFKQKLRNNIFSYADVIGIAYLGYEFNSVDEFVGIHLLKVESLPEPIAG
jgi:hypothetical protein